MFEGAGVAVDRTVPALYLASLSERTDPPTGRLTDRPEPTSTLRGDVTVRPGLFVDPGYVRRGVEYCGVTERGVLTRGVETLGVGACGVEMRGVETRGLETRGVETRGVET